eukprot:CAMPEP_0177674744 /NCGR_PEP_ID=MMETSP0447-20121125/26763_1 /TAXON_ID=0 /ORGANISM="Stygamoeba regulata, Strain BSH-02190019" /LENGTH=626 /DNA_ID=CAMNT_0019182949 /DNA_START=14 /DNA_END=1894 /DNA_ORIENTATION=-
MNKLEFSPLSGSDLQLKATLKKKYQSFWNNLAFRRGQARPIFSVSEADALLDRAAELVVLIRRAYQQAGVRLPNQIEGHSSDFLWTAVVLHLNPATFVRDLVHASLSDADGYFEGVNADDVDAAIESLDRSYMQHEAKNLGSEEARLRSDILKNAEPVIKLVKELFSNPDDTLIMDDVDAQMAKLRISTLQSIKSTLSNLEKHLHVLHRQQLGDSGTTTPTSQKASTSSDKEAAQPDDAAAAAPAAVEPEPKIEPTPEPTPPLSSSRSGDGGSEASETFIKIGKIGKDVERFGADLRSLKADAESVDVQNQDSEQKVSALQKKCAYLTNELMRDLLELDSIVGSGADARTERKKKVTQVQSLLDDCDRVRERLGKLQHELHEQKAAASGSSSGDESAATSSAVGTAASAMEEGADADEEEEAEDEMQDADQAAAAQAESPPSSKKPKHESKWAKLRLRPQFDVQESANEFTLQTYVPNMAPDSIKVNVSEDGSTLTVEGFREPTAEEEEYLRRVLARRVPQQLTPEVEEDLLLRLGAGRYGAFREQYRLPAGDVDVENLEATYKGGYLLVVVPKNAECRAREERERDLRERRQRANAAAARRASPFFRGAGGNPFGGLFGYDDMWA